MRLVELSAEGYRNLNTTVPLSAPLAVLVGENNAGKSNVVDALRTVLEPEAGPRNRNWLRPEDFGHDGTGSDPLSDELEISVVLDGLSPDEKGRLVTCLSPSIGPDSARIRVKALLGADGRIQANWYGGDSEHSGVESYARDAVRFVYLHPLRDAASDLRPGRDNKLVKLLNSAIPPEHDDRSRVVDVLSEANLALDKIESVVAARKQIEGRLEGMTGGGRYSQKSDLAFEDPQFDRVVASLRAKIGDVAALEMSENGLGYNNLLYMAVLLAALADTDLEEGPVLRVLLVEEPEAHLHPQLQQLLMQFLELEADPTTQVIVTSHSPNFASTAKVERLTVLTRLSEDRTPVALAPASFGLEEEQLAHLQRFLDVTKASLFFARGVILVEGIAEQLLVPALATRIGVPLAPSGVTVINIGGVAFAPFTDLFGKDRLPSRLAVITDSDPANEADDEIPETMSPRASKLKARIDGIGGNARLFRSERTLEWDLMKAGNQEPMIEALSTIKPKAGPKFEKDVSGLSAEQVADALQPKIQNVKGIYAQVLASKIENSEDFHVPKYLTDAIKWAAGADELGAD